MNKNVLIFSIVVVFLSAATIVAAFNELNEVPADDTANFVPIVSKTLAGISDKTTALNMGIKGYISIDAKESGKVHLNVSTGNEVIIPIVIKFISYDSSLTEAKINIDPQNPYTLIVEQAVEGGTLVRFNDFVKYSLTGDVTVKSGVPLEIAMSVKIPIGVPHFTVPLYIVGIESDYHVISNIQGDVIA